MQFEPSILKPRRGYECPLKVFHGYKFHQSAKIFLFLANKEWSVEYQFQTFIVTKNDIAK